MLAEDLETLGLLQDPARRRLYAYVVAQGRDVSRNEAAEAVGMQRTLAAFHLDRLARGGLLDVAYRRVSGRSGPGSGRPAKLYRRAPTEVSVSVPARAYGVAAAILAEAVERTGAEEALFAAARASAQACASVAELRAVLTERGYEPYDAESTVRLRNCPFHQLAQEYPVLACGMNLAVLTGLLPTGVEARLDPRPGECCVVLTASKTNQD